MKILSLKLASQISDFFHEFKQSRAKLKHTCLMFIHNLLLKNKTKYIYSGVKKTNILPVTSDLFPNSISQVHQSHYSPEKLGPFSHADKETRRVLISVGLLSAHSTSAFITSTSFIWSQFAGQKVLTDNYRQCMTWATSLQHRLQMQRFNRPRFIFV